MNTKNSVVTGSSRGIEQAVALEFAKAEYNLVTNSRNADELSTSRRSNNERIYGIKCSEGRRI